ncbi:LamG-like jellyroll fold domain-containing protein [Streptomyces sp. NPDC002328]|uniref:LamG-like jellyroll fold domain-containing protein n=1 Tax=Streptomyces sp. NPDC002328 TaxID=3364642 RepID=UPI0036C45B6D
MRPARPLVLAVAFVLSVLAGTEQVALAVGQSSSASGAGEAPDQWWGTAVGRGHAATADATDAVAKGGRAGALSGPGELPAESAAGAVDLPGAAPTPQPGPVTSVAPPASATPQGFDAGRSEEVAGERAERESTYLNPDGTYTTRFYTEPVNFRSEDGSWKPIDATLVPRESSGPSTMSADEEGWETSSTEARIEFAGTADADPVVRVQVDEGVSVGYGVDDAHGVAGQAEASTLTYENVRPHSDVEFLAGSDSVKETLVLKDAGAPTEWRFPLELEGLTAALDVHGNVVFADAGGAVRAWTPAGWMQDSNFAPDANEGVISSGVTYSLTVEDGRQVLVVKLDKAWLSAPERVFPVRVDPSVKSVDATSGTYVQYPYNQNFASDTVLKVGTYDGGSHKAAAFLRFAGLETSLKNAWVVGANLSLYNAWSQSCTARPVTVHPITSNWAETTTSKWPGPSTGASLASKSFAHGWRPGGTTTWACGPAWESINLGSAGRQLVDDWTHARKKNYGLAVKASTTDSKSWKQFGSDDYPNGKPSLDVTWTKYGATYKLGAFVTPITATAESVFKVTVTNRGQQTWPKNGNFSLRYHLYDAAGKEITDTSKIRWSPMPVDVPPGRTVTVDAKIAPLTPGDYTLAWTMNDNGVATFSGSGVPAVAMRVSAVNIPPYLTAEAPASGAVVTTLTPTLWASGADRDRYPKALQYQFEVCEVEGKNLRKNCKTGPRVASQQWAVTSGWLSWSKTYAWYGYAYDGSGTSVRPGPSLLTTQVAQPAITGHLGGSDGDRSFGERSGNYVTAATDAAVPTVGPELSVTRTYNSQDPRQKNAFGAGWSTRWDMRATAESTGSVVITLSAGSQVRFGKNADGSYAAPSGSTGLLKAETGGGWTLRDGSGTLHTFSPAGLLTKIADGHGQVQQLTYTDGKLTQAKDVLSGRTLTFTWSGGHVTAAETNAVNGAGTGLKWSYTYEGDRLVKVCPPSSVTACTVYSYEDGSLYRSTVLDAGPSAYWRLNEADGESATSEAVSGTGLNEALYRDVTRDSAGVLAGTGNKAGAFDGSESHLALPDDALGSSPFASVEMWFKTTKAGVLLSQANERMEDVDPSVSQSTPLLYVGTDGKLRGQFYYPGTTWTPMTSTGAVTDGAWHHLVLSGAGTSQTLYLDGTALGTKTGAIDHLEQRYTYVGLGWTDVPWQGIDKTDQLGHFDGLIDEVAVYDHTIDASTVADHFAAKAAASRITKVTLPSGRVDAEVTYDSDTERVTQVKEAGNGAWKISAPSYSAGSAAYSAAVRASGPTEYWRLGDRRGLTAASALTEGSDGEYGDDVALGTFGAFAAGDDTAASLNGDSHIQVADASLSGTALSAELWFRTDKAGILLTEANADISEDAVPTRATPLLYVGTDGKLHGQFYSETTNWTPPVSKNKVNDSQWHHAVLTGNGNTSALYVDGVLAGQVSGTITHLDQTRIFLGKGRTGSRWAALDSSDPWGHFSGAIDEVAFYPKALTAAEAGEHYRSRTGMVTGDGPHYRGAVTADAPAGYWRLDETSGSVAHSQSAALDGDGSYTNATLGADGVFGTGDNTALSLNGNGHAEIPGGILRGSTDLAIELWFKTTKPGVLIGDQSQPVSGTTATGTYAPLLYVGTDGKLHGKFYSPGLGTAKVASADSVNDDQWHHAVITAAGTAQTLYLDGVQAATLTGAVNHQSNTRTYIGAGYAKGWPATPGEVSHFTGQIDEVAVYRNGLTADQVAEHYRSREHSNSSALAMTITVTDPTGATTSTTYDALRGRRRTASTDAEQGVTTYAYDTGGFLHTVTDPNGHSTVTGHDARGNVVSTTACRDADSCATSFASYYLNTTDPLDPRNDKPLTSSDARSTDAKDTRYRTQYAYNDKGLPTSVTRPNGSAATTAYTTGTEAAVGGGTTPAGLVLTQTTPGGAKTSYRYHANGDVAEATSPSGLVTSYTYDGLGRKTAEKQTSDTFPDGVTTTYAYDAASHVVTETGVGVRNEISETTHTGVITRAFDEDGNLLSESTKDTTGGDTERTTAYRYNAHGLNDSVTDAEQNTTLLEHDDLGRVVGMTDPVGTHVTYTYTARGQHATTVLNGWTGDPSGTTRDLTVVSNAYDPAGRLASTTDAMGATTAYTYYDDSLAAATTAQQITQADGSRHDIVLEANAYDPAGNLTKQVTGGGTTTQTFTVDALGRTLTSVLDPAGLNRTATYAYDSDDRVKEQTQTVSGSKKLTTTSDYDAAGNVTKQTVTDGATTHTTTSAYDKRGLPLTTVSPRGNVTGADPAAHTTTYRYDALGRLVQQTAPPVQAEENGGPATTVQPTTLTGYNTFGEATHAKDARGKVTHTDLDRLGRTTAVTLPDYTPPGSTTPLTATTRTTYTALGRPRTVTDPLGRTTRYAYDQFGQLTAKTDPAADATAALAAETDSDLLNPTSTDGGGITRYTWTPTGLQLSVTDPMGARSESTYDELGRKLTATAVERYPSPANLVSRYTWDDANNQTASVSPSGLTTTGTYNAAGEPRTVTDPAGTTRFDYDGLGRQTEAVDPTNRRTTTAYDALGDVTATTDYGTGATALRTASAEYDAEGNRTAAVSAQTKARTTWAYDALGRRTTQVEPVSATASTTTSFGYDAASNLTRLTDGRGSKTVYTFTGWGLPESTIEPSTPAHPNPADRTWTTIYDKAGQAVKEILPGGVQRERTYDGLGRLTRETGTGAEAATATRTLEHDLTGRLTAIGTADGLTRNTYTYNDRGQLLTADGPGGASRYAYNADGSMTQRTTDAGTTDYTYDGTGRIDAVWDSITGNNVLYDFDAAGRPSREQYAAKPSGAATYTITAKRTYGYDDLGRLHTDSVTSADGATNVASTTYGYDLDDNLTSKTTAGTAGAGANTYAYDHASRLTSWTKDGTTTPYEWDAAGNRTKAGSTTAVFDARNRRLTDGTTTYAYTARGTLSSASAGSGNPRALTFDAFERKITDGDATYAYDSLDRVQSRGTTTFTYDGGSNNLTGDGTTDYNRTPEGALLSFSTGTTKQWALTDQHTDLVAGLTPDATQLGGSTSYDPFGKETASGGTTPAVGYQSGYTDPDSADVNMEARWYQPGSGAFTSRDTWQLDPMPSGRANRYAYANAGPLNYIDPSGHDGHTIVAPGPVRPRPDKPSSGGWFPSFSTGIRYLKSFGRRGLRASGFAADVFLQVIGWNTPAYAPGYTPPPPSSGGGGGGAQQASGTSWLVRTGPGTAASTGVRPGMGTGMGTGGCRYGCVVKPPKPPIDQNPNNGPQPLPAPNRGPVKVDLDPNIGKWDKSKGWDAVFDTGEMLGLADGQYTPQDMLSLAALEDLFPDQNVDPDLGFGQSGANPNAKRTRHACSRDFPSTDPSFYYAPMTRFGPGPEDCRATGAVAYIDAFDLRPWRLDPKWKPAGYDRLPVGNRAALHLIGNQMGGANDTLRNFVAGYQTPANSPHMRSLEDEITRTVKSGQHVALGVVPVYGGKDLAIPTEIRMNAVGDGGYRLNCTVYNRPSGGYSCSERTSGGNLSIP